MNDLFQGFESIRAYMDNPLILTEVYWRNHVQKLELTLRKMKSSELKFNIEKLFLGQTKMKY